jgi:AcrR family transcriptional regulator
MRKGEATREAIVGRALSDAVSLGLDGLTLGALAESLSLSKSGLFAHFRSKEALQLAVLDEAVARFQKAVVTPALKAKVGRERLEVLFDKFLAWMRGHEELGGCPFVVFTQEFAGRPGPLRDRVVGIQKEWQAFIATCVGQAVKAHALKADTDPAQFAFEFMGAGLAYQRASKLMGDRSALKRAHATFEAMLDRATA